MQGGFNPTVVAKIAYKFDIKLKLAVEGGPIRLAVAINEVSRIRHGETVLAEEPLIHFHLAFIRDLPICINVYFGWLTGGLVINNVKLSFRINPDVINAAGDDKVSILVVELDTSAQGIAPLFHSFVLEGHRIDAVLFAERMTRTAGAMNVELFLEECVDSVVEIEGEGGRLGYTQSSIKIETTRTFQEHVNFTARNLEGLRACRVEQRTPPPIFLAPRHVGPSYHM